MGNDIDKTKEPFISGHLYRGKKHPNKGKYMLCTTPFYAAVTDISRVTKIPHRCLIDIDTGELVASTPTFAYYEDVTEELMKNDE